MRALRFNDRQILYSLDRNLSALAERGKQFLLEPVSREEEKKMGIPWETAKHVLAHLGAEVLFDPRLLLEDPLKYVDPFHFCRWDSVMIPVPLAVPWWLQEAAGMVNNRFECDACLKVICLRHPALALRSANNAPFTRLVERKAADLVRIVNLKGATGEAVARWLLDPASARSAPPAAGSVRSVVFALLGEDRLGPGSRHRWRALEGLTYGLKAVLPYLHRTKYAPPGTERYFQGIPANLLEFASRVLEAVLEGLMAARAIAEHRFGPRDEAQQVAAEWAGEVFRSLFLLASAFDHGHRLVLGGDPRLLEFFAPLFVPAEVTARAGAQA
ncbi:MAG: hypothetical protein ACPLPT_06160 [Moorellales bacterium]